MILKEKYPQTLFRAKKGLSIDDVGVSRDTAFQEIRPGAGFEAGDFVREKLGSYYYCRTTLLLTRYYIMHFEV